MLIATHNRGKIREYRALFQHFNDDVVGLDDLGITDEVEETGPTFAENALLKARAFALLSGTETLADDSGLEVDALDGRPGVFSARYAGPDATDEERYRKLLDELQGTPAHQRRARFRCAVAVAWPDGRIALTTGTCEGEIAHQPSGTNGFGYDPVFVVPEHRCTMAELPEEIKNTLSHRARATRALLQILGRCDARQE
ncbi:MAG: XTP/dITP diphosphatase [Anaerolineae bacterium]